MAETTNDLQLLKLSSAGVSIPLESEGEERVGDSMFVDRVFLSSAASIATAAAPFRAKGVLAVVPNNLDSGIRRRIASINPSSALSSPTLVSWFVNLFSCSSSCDAIPDGSENRSSRPK